jgi:hypothetical protein
VRENSYNRGWNFIIFLYEFINIKSVIGLVIMLHILCYTTTKKM